MPKRRDTSAVCSVYAISYLSSWGCMLAVGLAIQHTHHMYEGSMGRPASLLVCELIYIYPNKCNASLHILLWSYGTYTGYSGFNHYCSYACTLYMDNIMDDILHGKKSGGWANISVCLNTIEPHLPKWQLSLNNRNRNNPSSAGSLVEGTTTYVPGLRVKRPNTEQLLVNSIAAAFFWITCKRYARFSSTCKRYIM